MPLPVLPEAFYSELYLVADAANLCWLGQAVKGSTGSQKVHGSRGVLALKHPTVALVYDYVEPLL